MWQGRPAGHGEDFRQLQSRLVDNVVLLVALSLLVGTGVSLARALHIGWQTFMGAHVALLVACWALVLWRRTLAYQTKVAGFIGILLVGASAGYLHLGPAADGKAVYSFIAIAAALFLSPRAALALIVGVAVLLSSMGIAAASGWLRFDLDYASYARDPLSWANAIWTITVYTAILAYIAAAMITQLRANDARSQQLLADARESQSEAERASAAKSAFLANMSHEIRTPMNAVTGMLELLQRTPLSPQQDSYLRKARLASDSLLAILNDILDFSRIESGKLSVASAPFLLEELLARVSNLVAHRAAEKQLEFVVDEEPGLPAGLVGDAMRLTQVLVNLAGNAVKFTEHGEVRLGVRKLADTADGVLLRFHCQDTGIGIDPAEQGRLFGAFEQADGSISRRFGGTGLGLSICQRLLALMDSRLELESEPGRGTRVWFDIALPRAPEEAAAGPALRQLPGLRVLLVEDNQTAREVAARLLRSFGVEVLEAADAEQALRLIEGQPARPCTLALLDWKLPGMDGIALAAQLRERAPPTQAPRIVLCTSCGVEEARKADPSGVLDAVLEKPLMPSALFEALAPGLIAAVAEGAGPVGVPELGGTRVLLVDDVELNRQVAGELLASAGVEVSFAADGEQALRRLEQEPLPDLVLMDVQMPRMDGITATQRLRETLDAERLPIIAMTAHAFDEEVQRCLAAGMQAHLAKPIEPARLYSLVARYSGSRRRDDAARPEAPSTALPPALRTLAGMDAEAGLRRVLGQRALYLSMLQRFVERYADAPQQIGSALDEGRDGDARSLAHALRGAAATLGAERIAALAGEIEYASAARSADASLTQLDEALQALRRALPELAAG